MHHGLADPAIRGGATTLPPGKKLDAVILGAAVSTKSGAMRVPVQNPVVPIFKRPTPCQPFVASSVSSAFNEELS